MVVEQGYRKYVEWIVFRHLLAVELLNLCQVLQSFIRCGFGSRIVGEPTYFGRLTGEYLTAQ